MYLLAFMDKISLTESRNLRRKDRCASKKQPIKHIAQIKIKTTATGYTAAAFKA